MDKLFLLHVLFMSLTIILSFTAIIFAHRRKDNWFSRHRIMAGAAALCALAGFFCMFILKISNDYAHLKSLHAILGAFAILFIIITPVLGLLVMYKKNKLRLPHRVFGRIAFGLILLTGLMGLFRIIVAKS